MTFEARKLTTADNAALLALARTSTTGSEQFWVDRSPDFFALGQSFGECSHYGVFDGAELVGSLAVARQVRFIAQRAEETPYIHDLRTHPRVRGSRALARLLAFTSDIESAEGRWGFATVLGENPRAASMLCRRFGAKLLGSTLHLGVPLLVPRRIAPGPVFELASDVAWGHYLDFATKRDFAPADREIFEQGVRYLALQRSGSVVAVCRVFDESAARKLIRGGQLGLTESALRRACIGFGRCPPPAAGEAFRFAYLTHCACAVPEEQAAACAEFAAYLSRSDGSRFSHAVYGLPLTNSPPPRFGELRLSSSTYSLGPTPNKLALDFHELSLI